MPQAVQSKDRTPPAYSSSNFDSEDGVVGSKPGVERYPELDRKPKSSSGVVAIVLVMAAALAFGAYYYYSADTVPFAPVNSTDVAPATPPAVSTSEPEQPVSAPTTPVDPAPPPAINQTPATPPVGTQQ